MGFLRMFGSCDSTMYTFERKSDRSNSLLFISSSIPVERGQQTPSLPHYVHVPFPVSFCLSLSHLSFLPSSSPILSGSPSLLPLTYLVNTSVVSYSEAVDFLLQVVVDVAVYGEWISLFIIVNNPGVYKDYCG